MPKTHLQKCTALLLSLVLCLGLVGCSSTQNSTPQSKFELGSGADTPEEAVEHFLTAYFTFDSDLYNEYAHPLPNGGLENFIISDDNAYNEAIIAVLKKFSTHNTYEIVDISPIENDQVEVTISLNYYDASPALIDITKSFLVETPPPSNQEYSEYIYNKAIDINLYDYNVLSTEITLQLLSINDRWYVIQPYIETRHVLLSHVEKYVSWVKNQSN